jgi:uncharacterized protein YbaR (Trm112 family)/ubiquinone/menaquinone biosynthesis C-methylase UbiE
MQESLLEMLECPICHGSLDWTLEERIDDRIEHAEAQCSRCSEVYPVRDGIGVFLTPDLPRNDLWEQVDSQISSYMRDHPDLEDQLMSPPVEALSPTDRQIRAQLLDERGDFERAQIAETLAHEALYTPAYRRCWNKQVEFVLQELEGVDGLVVDLASGRGYLVEKLVERVEHPIVTSDFSLHVLRRNKRYFDFLGFGNYVSLLAFDARLTPFKDRVIETMTTNLGLPNIENPGRLLHELGRIIGGELMAISHFFPEEDESNRSVIEEAGLAPLLYKQSALKQFKAAGWEVSIENVCTGEALPSPESEIFEGSRADGLPVAPTELEWCVIRAVNRQ